MAVVPYGPELIGGSPEPPSRAIQIVWFTVLFGGQIGLLAFLLTLFLSKSLTPRLYVLQNFLIITFLGNPIYLFLFYSGDYSRESVAPDICAAQAALLHGLDCAFTLSSLLHVFESWRVAVVGPSLQDDIYRTWIILLIPYVHWISTTIGVFCLSAAHPEEVYRASGSFYCMYHGAAARAVYVEYAVIGLLILIVQGFFCHLFWTRRCFLSGVGIELPISRSMFLRVALFTLIQIFGVVSVTAMLMTEGHIAITYCLSSFCASASLLVVLVFATQQDILDLWFRCLYRSRSKPQVATRLFATSTSLLPTTSTTTTFIDDSGLQKCKDDDKLTCASLAELVI
ncbi:hypothetical protein SISSUDRAFT_1046138, partial [Sistotremastrum suecicum HHB10207 ss-3]